MIQVLTDLEETPALTHSWLLKVLFEFTRVCPFTK